MATTKSNKLKYQMDFLIQQKNHLLNQINRTIAEEKLSRDSWNILEEIINFIDHSPRMVEDFIDFIKELDNKE